MWVAQKSRSDRDRRERDPPNRGCRGLGWVQSFEERRLRVTQSPFWVTLIYHKSHLSEDIFLPRSAGLIQFIVLQHFGIDIEDYFLGYVRQMIPGPLQFAEYTAKTETERNRIRMAFRII